MIGQGEAMPVPRPETPKQVYPPVKPVQFSLDKSGMQVTGVNDHARSFFSIPEPAEGEQKPIGLSNLLTTPEASNALSDHLKGITRDNPEATGTVQTGDGKWLQVTTVARFAPDGSIASYDSTGFDVTATVEAVNKAAKAKIEEAQQRAANAEETAGIIAHDMRGPLTLIRGYVHMMEGAAPEDKAKFVNIILANIEYGTKVCTDFLDLMKLENGLMSFKPESVNVGEMTQSLKDAFRIDEEKTGGSLTIGDELPQVMGSPQLVRQVLTNLLSNAFKYGGPHPQVEVRARRLEGGGVRYEVQDHGPGIPADKMNKLFTKFGRLGLEAHKNIKGTGLGLAACKTAIELQGGAIGAESTEGSGSTFYFILPEAMTGEKPSDSAVSGAPAQPSQG